MGLSRLEPTVTLVNRLVDDDGNKIPQDFMYDGDCLTITDQVTVPWSVGRIIFHHSMRRLDPVTMRGTVYSLGCAEYGFPSDPLPLSTLEQHNELVDRDLLGHNKRVQPTHVHNPIMRVDPINMRDPGREDGAFAGGFGKVPEQGGQK